MEHVELHMQESDAFAWYMEKDPLLRSTIVTVALLDRVPDWGRVVDKLDRASRLIPGFRQHVVTPPLRLSTPRWAYDPNFDLSWHLRRICLPRPGDLGVLLDFARKEGMSDFDRARPLWELTLVEGLQEGAEAALVLKIHHSLTDGVGGMQLALMLFDLQAEPSEPDPMPDAPEGEELGGLELIKDALAYDVDRVSTFVRHHAGSAVTAAAHAALHPGAAVADILKTARSVVRVMEPAKETLSPVMRDRRLSWRYDLINLPLDNLKRSAKWAGASINDGFLAGITGGFRRYHERHGRSVDSLRVTMPLSVRKEDDPVGGNRISLMRFKVPVGIVDPVERIAQIQHTTAKVRSEPSLPLTQAIAGTLNLMPRSYIGGMLKHVDFLASNVPGFWFPVYFGGAKLLGYYAFGPTIGSSVNLTLISYCDTCFIGVNTDTGAVRDSDVLLTSLREGFEEVLDLSGKRHRPVELPQRDGRRSSSSNLRAVENRRNKKGTAAFSSSSGADSIVEPVEETTSPSPDNKKGSPRARGAGGSASRWGTSSGQPAAANARRRVPRKGSTVGSDDGGAEALHPWERS